eukprot:Selendium_serpulae@DN2602_c0_g1_i2.p1
MAAIRLTQQRPTDKPSQPGRDAPSDGRAGDSSKRNSRLAPTSAAPSSAGTNEAPRRPSPSAQTRRIDPELPPPMNESGRSELDKAMQAVLQPEMMEKLLRGTLSDKEVEAAAAELGLDDLLDDDEEGDCQADNSRDGGTRAAESKGRDGGADSAAGDMDIAQLSAAVSEISALLGEAVAAETSDADREGARAARGGPTNELLNALLIAKTGASLTADLPSASGLPLMASPFVTDSLRRTVHRFQAWFADAEQTNDIPAERLTQYGRQLELHRAGDSSKRNSRLAPTSAAPSSAGTNEAPRRPSPSAQTRRIDPELPPPMNESGRSELDKAMQAVLQPEMMEKLLRGTLSDKEVEAAAAELGLDDLLDDDEEGDCQADNSRDGGTRAAESKGRDG